MQRRNRNFPKGRRRIMVLVLYLRVQKPELQELTADVSEQVETLEDQLSL
jgi:hypothetical protein